MDKLDQLAFATQKGRPGAFTAFVSATYNSVWALCASLVDRQSADDLTQETYYRCIGAIVRFRGDSSARTWLLAIARRVCIDEIRFRSRFRTTDLENVKPADDQLVPDVAESVTVSDLLARLSPDRKEAFVLTQLIGLPYDEAARVCGCPPGTIRSRTARARNDLITMLRAEQSALTRFRPCSAAR
jgi:RNA polymerase sigma-70 factor, ECF subfamily